jgi:hypothetical protein
VSSPDAHVRDTLNRTLDTLRRHLEAEIAGCQDDLIRSAQETGTRLAAEAAETAAAAATREAELRISELRETAALEARAAEEQRAVVAAELGELHRALQELRDEHHRNVEDSTRQIAERDEQLLARQQCIEDHQRRIDDQQRALEESTRQIEDRQQYVESARLEADALRRDLETARQEASAAQHDVDAVRRDVESVRRIAERVAHATRLPEAIRHIDRATTFGEVLDGLVERSAREAGRAAVFVVKGERLRSWKTIGFESAPDTRLDIALTESGPMAEAVRTGLGVARRHDSPRPLPAFAQENGARHAVVWPISVGGAVVAVLYADGGIADNQEEPYWPEFLEVLARYTGRVLEGMTVHQAARLATSRPSPSGSGPQSMGRQPAGSLQ